MNKNNLVSIIIPIFNIENFVEECVNSAISQTYKNLEIILVNDGSTDKSLEICMKFKEKDKRIQVYSKKNGGLSDARNYGIDHATGDYIFFLDGDDLIQEDTIEIMLKVLPDKNAISICSFERFKNTTKKCLYNNKIEKFTVEEYFYSILNLNNDTHACGCLIPKDLIKDIYFIKDRYFEDLSTMYKIFDRSSCVFRIYCGLYKYRVNENSIVHTINQKKLQDYILSSKEMVDFLAKNYTFSEKKINAYLSYINVECYILSKDEKYLYNANQLLKKADLHDIRPKAKLKLLLFKNKFIAKLILKLKK